MKMLKMQMQEAKPKLDLFKVLRGQTAQAASSPVSPVAPATMDRKLEKKTWTPKRLVMIAAATLVVALISYAVLNSGGSRLGVNAEKLTLSRIARGKFQEFIPVTGTVLPLRIIFLDAIEGGRIEKIYIEQGSAVSAGDTILKLANSNFLLEVMNREAQLFDQQSNLRNTRLTIEQTTIARKSEALQVGSDLLDQTALYNRTMELAKSGLVSKQESEQVKNKFEYLTKREILTRESLRQDALLRDRQLKEMNAAERRLQMNLAAVRQSLDNLVVRAPQSGQLSILDAEIGQSKQAGERLGQVDLNNGFKVRAGVDEYYINRVSLGQTAEVSVPGGEKSYRLTVKKVFPAVKDGKFEIDFEFVGNVPEGIRRGQTLQLRLELGLPAEALLVPRGGFYQKTGGNWIYVIDKSEGVAVKRSIKLGRQNPEFFEVLDGLKAGEEVITSSYENFGENDKLILKK